MLPDSFFYDPPGVLENSSKRGFLFTQIKGGFTLKVYTLGLGDTNETLELKEVKHLEPLSLECVELPIPVEA